MGQRLIVCILLTEKRCVINMNKEVLRKRKRPYHPLCSTRSAALSPMEEGYPHPVLMGDGTWRQGFFVELPLVSPYIIMVKMARITNKSLSPSTIGGTHPHLDGTGWGYLPPGQDWVPPNGLFTLAYSGTGTGTGTGTSTIGNSGVPVPV